MMRSLYSAVSGLKTHQTRMDVIGNNIANVNTEAFKASSVRFSEIMYQTTSGASAGNGASGTGGKNAKQIGLGVKSGATAANITGAGSAETTGNPFDLRLNDKNATNFFVVSDGTNRLFTRAGDFYVDGNGYLCMSSTGYTLQGWQVDAKGNVIKDTVSSLQVMSSATKTSAPEATTKAYVSGVLDKNDAQAADTGRIITIGFFDDLGYNYTAKFGIKKTNTDGTYDVTLKDIVDSKGNSIFDVDKDGNFITSQGPNGQTMYSYKGRAVDPQTIFEDASLVFDQSEGTFTSISSANSPAAKTINLNLSVLNTQDASINGSNFSNIEVDFSKSMNYNNNGTSTIGGMNGDLQGDGKGNDADLAKELSISEDELCSWQSQLKVTNVVSLDEFDESGPEPVMDAAHNSHYAQPEEIVTQEELKTMLVKSLDNLTEKERRVIELYYYEDLTLKEISNILEVSESRVSQLHTKGLIKMRKVMGPYMNILTNA